MNRAFKISPENLLGDWGYFESWSSGDSSAPDDGWSLVGAGASIAKESSIIKFGTYSAKVTRAGTDCTLQRSLLTTERDLTWWQGKTLTVGFWAYVSVADRSKLYVQDGVAQGNSSYNTTGSAWEFLSFTMQVDPAATRLDLYLSVSTADQISYFDGGILVVGENLFTDLSDYIKDWRPDVRKQISKFIAPRKEGVYIPNVKYRERKITLKGNIAGSDFSDSRTSFDTLVAAISTEKRDLFLFDDRLIKAFLTKVSYNYLASLRMIDFAFEFTAPEPFYRYLASLRDKQTISSSPTSYNFAYGGNVETNPIIIFSPSGNNMTACVLENQTTGQSMSFTGTVTDGDDLVIDCDEMTVENDGVDAIADFSGDFLKLVPGTNYLKFTGSNTVIKIDYFKKWL